MKDRPWWWNLFHGKHWHDDLIQRRRLPNILYGGSGFGGHRSNPIVLPNYEYWCPKCDSLLEDGPRGGMSVNAVCKKCDINYGCLYGFRGFFVGS
jgi:hypothetical protein